MAESIVKVPSREAQGLDFLAFSFNGKHSWDDFHIYRTSDGDRYNENLTPTLADKTAEVPGGDGMYYFGTTHGQRDFNISFAFDSLTEVQLRELKKWLNGKEMGDLWFQEAPYKVWTAKPAGNSSIKYIPFDDENGQRVYKGEGTVQFVAYWPYAHTPDYIEYGWFFAKAYEYYALPFSTNYGLYYKTEKINRSATLTVYNSERRSVGSIGFTASSGNITLTGTPMYVRVDTDSYILIREYSDSEAAHTPIRGNGKNLSSYSQFANKEQWAVASGLDENVGTIKGDLPTTFIAELYGDYSKGSVLGDREKTITLLEACKDPKWNSKTGIVSGKIVEGGIEKERAIKVSGETINSFKPGESGDIIKTKKVLSPEDDEYLSPGDFTYFQFQLGKILYPVDLSFTVDTIGYEFEPNSRKYEFQVTEQSWGGEEDTDAYNIDWFVSEREPGDMWLEIYVTCKEEENQDTWEFKYVEIYNFQISFSFMDNAKYHYWYY